jgi:hypothetical protein
MEIAAFRKERKLTRPVPMICPFCMLDSELLTARQSGALAQVRPQSIYRWLAAGKVHGVRTAGGRHRICRNSLFKQEIK